MSLLHVSIRNCAAIQKEIFLALPLRGWPFALRLTSRLFRESISK